MVYVLWFIYPILCWFWCPEIGANRIDWSQLGMISPDDGDKAQYSKRCLKKRTFESVQKVNNYNNFLVCIVACFANARTVEARSLEIGAQQKHECLYLVAR
jgi:hypothetical protein